MLKQPLNEWREEAAQRFGEKGRNWKFVCPKCGNVQSGQDFIDKAGMTPAKSSNFVYQNCIGRHVKGIGCDWAAYGLFGTLGKGRMVVMEDGEEVEVFDFAEAEVTANA